MSTTEMTTPAKRVHKMARVAQPTTSSEIIAGANAAAQAEQRQSKAALVLGLLQRPDGTTLSELVEATGWQPHTMRAALTGLRKKGHTLTSEKVGDVRRYRIVSPEQQGGAGQ